MKFLWFNIETKKELRKKIYVLECDLTDAEEECDHWQSELNYYKQFFPLDIGSTVYDIQLRDSKGKYTKDNASREHSYFTEVEVTEKNYFGLVERLKNNDVFTNSFDATEYMDRVCK